MTYHLWLVNVRLRYEGYEGGQLQHELFQRFWSDFKERLDQDVGHPVIISRYKQAAKDRYHGFWISLDYGMMSGDAFLANSIFRNFFGVGKGQADAHSVSMMVEYTHRVLLALDFHPSEELIKGLLCFPKISEEMRSIYTLYEKEQSQRVKQKEQRPSQEETGPLSDVYQRILDREQGGSR